MTDFLGAPSCSSAFIFWNRPVNCSSHGNPPDPLNVIAAVASRPVSPHHLEASNDPKENKKKTTKKVQLLRGPTHSEKSIL
jgi:hypothetical protein